MSFLSPALAYGAGFRRGVRRGTFRGRRGFRRGRRVRFLRDGENFEDSSSRDAHESEWFKDTDNEFLDTHDAYETDSDSDSSDAFVAGEFFEEGESIPSAAAAPAGTLDHVDSLMLQRGWTVDAEGFMVAPIACPAECDDEEDDEPKEECPEEGKKVVYECYVVDDEGDDCEEEQEPAPCPPPEKKKRECAPPKPKCDEEPECPDYSPLNPEGGEARVDEASIYDCWVHDGEMTDEEPESLYCEPKKDMAKKMNDAMQAGKSFNANLATSFKAANASDGKVVKQHLVVQLQGAYVPAKRSYAVKVAMAPCSAAGKALSSELITVRGPLFEVKRAGANTKSLKVKAIKSTAEKLVGEKKVPAAAIQHIDNLLQSIVQ